MKRNSAPLAIMAITLLSSGLAFAQLEANTQAEDAARNRADSRAVPSGREQVQPAPQNNQARPQQARPERPNNPGYSNNYRRDDRDYRGDRGYGANNYYRYDEPRYGPGYQNYHLRRGGYLPPQYRHRQYVVNDWYGHRLSRPPAGYHWVQVGGDYVLVAITTGIILQLMLSN